jgi:hypothetical protein
MLRSARRRWVKGTSVRPRENRSLEERCILRATKSRPVRDATTSPPLLSNDRCFSCRKQQAADSARPVLGTLEHSSKTPLLRRVVSDLLQDVQRPSACAATTSSSLNLIFPTCLFSLSLFDEPQPREANDGDHHDDENGVLHHWTFPELRKCSPIRIAPPCLIRCFRMSSQALI